MKKKKTNHKDFSNKVRGLFRKRHFESGGTLEQWRGRNKIQPDVKKDNLRKKCRENISHDDE